MITECAVIISAGVITHIGALMKSVCCFSVVIYSCSHSAICAVMEHVHTNTVWVFDRSTAPGEVMSDWFYQPEPIATGQNVHGRIYSIRKKNLNAQKFRFEQTLNL